MNEKELKATVLNALASVVPELDEAHLAPEKNFREQLDIDSMDFLNFVIAVHRRLAVDIPELDYPKLITFDGAMAYLKAKLGLLKT